MISKELLSEVLKREVVKVKWIEANTLIYGCKLHDGFYDEINIYELANKCKEWAHTLGFMAQSYQYNTKARVDLLKSCDIDEIFIEETEPEAIFKACEWILKAIKLKSNG